MKKKNLMMLFFAATLGLTSCDDIQDLNLNLGNRTYVNEYEGLIAAVNNLSATLKERIDALSELLKKGLADVKVSIDENTSTINIVGQDINTTLFNGFKAVATQIDETGVATITAIDNNGNLLRLQIDTTGQLISTQLATSTTDIINAMNNNTIALSEKLNLIKGAIETGLVSVKEGEDLITKALTEMKSSLDTSQTKIANYLSQLVVAFDTLNTKVTTTNTKLGEIKDLIVKDLADNGITINSDEKSVFVTPEIWDAIESSGSSSQLYKVFMNTIKVVTLPSVKSPVQVTPGAVSSWHHCAKFTNLGYSDGSLGLRAATLTPEKDANGKKVIKVIKSPSEVKFRVDGLGGCSYPNFYCIRVYDARGDVQVYGGATGNVTGTRAEIGEATSQAVPTSLVNAVTITLKSYDNGRIVDDVKAYVFTYSSTSDLPTLFWPSDAPTN